MAKKKTDARMMYVCLMCLKEQKERLAENRNGVKKGGRGGQGRVSRGGEEGGRG